MLSLVEFMLRNLLIALMVVTFFFLLAVFIILFKIVTFDNFNIMYLG